MALLIINSGSSSLKLSLFSESLERIRDSRPERLNLKAFLKGTKVEAVGHRFVHGGDKYLRPTKLTAAVLRDLEQFNELAPLHNPRCLALAKECLDYFGPKTPQFALFDTAFHSTLPPHASHYAIPHSLEEKYPIKRYGFHGLSHAFLAASCPKEKLITLHLGSGCSMAAILNGRSIDTSMGFTPSEGLIMGTRSGDIDFSLVDYLTKVEQKSVDEIAHLLNFQSGLLGISQKTSDIPKLLKSKDPLSQLAIDMFCYRIVKYIGAYVAALNGVDALVFSAGIGENSAPIREMICSHLSYLGLKLSPPKNARTFNLKPGQKEKISQPASSVEVYVIATDENLFIAKEILSIIA